MIKITSEDLVRYLYGETSTQKTARIKVALQIDSDLASEYEQLQSTYSNLNKEDVKLTPRTKTIENILEYAALKQKQLQSI